MVSTLLWRHVSLQYVVQSNIFWLTILLSYHYRCNDVFTNYRFPVSFLLYIATQKTQPNHYCEQFYEYSYHQKNNSCTLCVPMFCNRSRVSRFALRLGVLQVCASLSSLTFSSRLVCFLWTVLPCLFMFANTIAYAFRCQPRKQLYLIAFVDLVPVAKEKVSLIRWNTVWNRWKSTLSARSIRVNLNHGKEM